MNIEIAASRFCREPMQTLPFRKRSHVLPLHENRGRTHGLVQAELDYLSHTGY